MNKHLNHLRSRQHLDEQYDEKYSWFIRRMRLFLPIIAVCIITAVVVWVSMNEKDIIVTQDPGLIAKAARNELLTPDFHSVDSKNRPFNIKAIRAVQDGQDNDAVLLDKPKGSLTLGSGNTIFVEALSGRYGQVSRKLDLSTNVRIYDAQERVMTMPFLNIDLTNTTAVSNGLIEGYGPEGLITGLGFYADSDNDILIIKGPAMLQIFDSDFHSSFGF